MNSRGNELNAEDGGPLRPVCPASAFYVTGGTLRHNAPCYVERRADRDLYEGLKRGEFCYVLTARQMGKSSLMVRTAARLREEGVAVVMLDLTAIGQGPRHALSQIQTLPLVREIAVSSGCRPLGNGSVPLGGFCHFHGAPKTHLMEHVELGEGGTH